MKSFNSRHFKTELLITPGSPQFPPYSFANLPPNSTGVFCFNAIFKISTFEYSSIFNSNIKIKGWKNCDKGKLNLIT